MEFKKCNSTNIKSYAYNAKTKELIIQFKSGNYYKYIGVPNKMYKNFDSSNSKGSFFHKFIKENFEFENVDLDEQGIEDEDYEPREVDKHVYKLKKWLYSYYTGLVSHKISKDDFELIIENFIPVIYDFVALKTQKFCMPGFRKIICVAFKTWEQLDTNYVTWPKFVFPKWMSKSDKEICTKVEFVIEHLIVEIASCKIPLDEIIYNSVHVLWLAYAFQGFINKKIIIDYEINDQDTIAWKVANINDSGWYEKMEAFKNNIFNEYADFQKLVEKMLKKEKRGW